VWRKNQGSPTNQNGNLIRATVAFGIVLKVGPEGKEMSGPNLYSTSEGKSTVGWLENK